MKSIAKAILILISAATVGCALPAYTPYNKYDSYARNITADTPVRQTRAGDDYWRSSLDKRGTPRHGGLFDGLSSAFLIGAALTGDVASGSVQLASSASSIATTGMPAKDIDRVSHVFGWVPKSVANTPQQALDWAFSAYLDAAKSALTDLGFEYSSMMSESAARYDSSEMGYRAALLNLRHPSPELMCGAGNRPCWFTLRMPISWTKKTVERGVVPDFLQGTNYPDQPAYLIFPTDFATPVALYTGNGKERHGMLPEMEFFRRMANYLPPELAIFLSQHKNVALGNGSYSKEAFVLQGGSKHRFIAQ